MANAVETLALRVNVTRSDSRFLEQNFASLWQVEEYFAFERSWFEGEVTLKGTMLLQKNTEMDYRQRYYYPWTRKKKKSNLI